MTTKAQLIEWLQKDSVAIISADVDGVPGLGEAITVTFTNADPANVLMGANHSMGDIQLSHEAQQRKEEDKKRTKEGWEE